MTKGRKYYGTGISTGLVCGKIKFLRTEKADKIKASTLESKEKELEHFEKARAQAIREIKELEKRALVTIGEKEAQIFKIHAMLLEDEDYTDAIIGEIKGGSGAAQAIKTACNSYTQMLEALGDEYLSARCADIKDISNHLVRILTGEVSVKQEKEHEPYILIASDLTPSQTVMLDKSNILGFVTFGGTPSSHTAILARAMGIPALVGTGVIERELDGKFALLNAAKDTLIICPSEYEISEFEKERQASNKIAKEHEEYLRSVMNKPAVTRGGHRVMIYANIGSDLEIASALSNGAEGIGLLRSEFLYLSKSNYPTEEELFYAYKDAAIKMQGKRVIIRTLDIGADKQIPYFELPKEENPALGYRAIRICLDRREMFKKQLRAILRASAFGRVAIMLPLVVSLWEITQSKAIIEECKRELSTQGIAFDSKIELGIMIETPASAVMSEELSCEVDFFSVGTNDLSQYTLACDRQNPMVTQICEKNTEPVMRLIKMSADAIHQNGGWIGVCGEMAADLSLTQRFVDMKIDELSVSIPYLLGVRGKVNECK
ncbi:MAG: phosphoenolpyruvate--protein phosphotransferase [Clostridia bacterium]|nr:phosphoenolpyruvate--protein phosphotransferase [Clostridia bacterium]